MLVLKIYFLAFVCASPPSLSPSSSVCRPLSASGERGDRGCFAQLAAIEQHSEAAEVVVSAEVAALVKRSWDVAMVPGGTAGHVIGQLSKLPRRGSMVDPCGDQARRSNTTHTVHPHTVGDSAVADPRKEQARRSSTSPLGGAPRSLVTAALPAGGAASPQQSARHPLQQPEVGMRSFGILGSLDLLLDPSSTIETKAFGPYSTTSEGQPTIMIISRRSLCGSPPGRVAVVSPAVLAGPGSEAKAATTISEAATQRRMAAALRMFVPGCVCGLLEESNLDFINE